MDTVLRDLVENECYVFIDYVIVFGRTMEEHVSRLQHVVRRIEKADLQLQPGKCVFAKPQVEYLGYIVSPDGSKASREKIRTVKD